jgi:hypothetical protein
MIGTRNNNRVGNASMMRQVEREIRWRAETRQKSLPKADADGARQMKFHALRTKLFGKFGLVSVVDQTIVAAGFMAALASAGFAGVMMSADNSRPMFGGIEHLMLFAQPIHGQPPVSIAQGQNAPLPSDIDFSATGSIGRKDPRLMDGSPAGMLPAQPTEPIIKTYALQVAEAGVAVVQGRGTSYRVQPGYFLPGAGRVLSIEQRDDKWVVVTTQGIIVARGETPKAP